MSNDQGPMNVGGLCGRMAAAVGVAAVLLAAFLLSLGPSGAAHADTNLAYRTVCPEAPADGCTYATIQGAIDDAEVGDVIRVVGNNVYVENLIITKSLTLLGGCTNAACAVRLPRFFATTIDGDGAGRVITIDGDGEPTAPITVTVDGFVITGGDPTTSGPPYEGGGIGSWDANLILSRNIITGNIGATDRTAWGAGVYVRNGTVDISNNQVLGNQAGGSTHGYGGGIALEYVGGRLESNLVQDNLGTDGGSGRGGGVFIDDSDDLVVIGNVIRNNTAAISGFGSGGGLSVEFSTGITLTDNVFYANTGSVSDNGYGGGVNVSSGAAFLRENTIRENVASRGDYGVGGGVVVWYGEAVLEHNTIVSNTGAFGNRGSGGGLYLNGAVTTLSGDTILSNTAELATSPSGNGIYASARNSVTATNVLVARNHSSGSGAAIEISVGALTNTVTFVNSTVADNTSAGIRCTGTPSATLVTVTLVNLILWGNDDDLACPVADLSYSDVEGGNTGPGVIHEDPLFVDPANLDYHLTIGSPCIDVGAGAAEFPWVPVDDWDGDSRPGGDGYDMGADEFWTYVFLPLLLKEY